MQFKNSEHHSILYKQYDRMQLLRNLFSLRYPIANKDNNISCTPFFIIGSGRSGNILLRAVLVSHPKLAIPPESYVLPRTVRIFQAYNFLPWKELVKLIVGEFESNQDFYTWGINLHGVYDRILSLDKDDRTLANIIDKIGTCSITCRINPCFFQD